MRKLKIGVDIDGVLVDIVVAMLPLLSNACGRQIYNKDIHCFDIGKALSIEKHMKDIWLSVYKNGLLLTASPIEGAIDGLCKLRQHEIWLVTHRPISTKADTEHWLTRNKIQYYALEFVDSGEKLSLGIKFDVFIEDNLNQACNIARAGITSLLLNQPWNQCDELPDHCIRFGRWEEIVHFVNTFSQ